MTFALALEGSSFGFCVNCDSHGLPRRHHSGSIPDYPQGPTWETGRADPRKRDNMLWILYAFAMVLIFGAMLGAVNHR
jgi:hypothetical protein